MEPFGMSTGSISTRETLGKARATDNEVDVIGLFLGFGALSLFWGYFRLRDRPGE
jgi:hypothetical protein